MLQKFEDANITIEEAIVKLEAKKSVNENADVRKVEGRSPNLDTPGEVVDASKLALEDLKDLLNYFKANFLDENGKLIKIRFWKWVFDKKYRDKIGGAIDYTVLKVKTIAGRFL